MHRVLKARILQVKAVDPTISLTERSEAQQEASRIEGDVQQEKDYRLWFDEATDEHEAEGSVF